MNPALRLVVSAKQCWAQVGERARSWCSLVPLGAWCPPGQRDSFRWPTDDGGGEATATVNLVLMGYYCRRRCCG